MTRETRNSRRTSAKPCSASTRTHASGRGRSGPTSPRSPSATCCSSTGRATGRAVRPVVPTSGSGPKPTSRSPTPDLRNPPRRPPKGRPREAHFRSLATFPPPPLRRHRPQAGDDGTRRRRPAVLRPALRELPRPRRQQGRFARRYADARFRFAQDHGPLGGDHEPHQQRRHASRRRSRGPKPTTSREWRNGSPANSPRPKRRGSRPAAKGSPSAGCRARSTPTPSATCSA